MIILKREPNSPDEITERRILLKSAFGSRVSRFHNDSSFHPRAVTPGPGSYYQDNSLLLSSPSLSSRGFHNSFASRVKSARLNPFSSSPLPSSSPVYFVNPTYQAVGASLDTQSVDSLFSKASASLSSHRSRSSYSPLKSTSTRPYSPPREPFPVSPSMRYSYPGPGTYSPETSLHSSSSYSIHESSSFISQAPRIAQIPLPSDAPPVGKYNVEATSSSSARSHKWNIAPKDRFKELYKVENGPGPGQYFTDASENWDKVDLNQHEKGSLLDYDYSVRPSTSAMSDYFTRLRAFSLSQKPIGLLPPISSTPVFGLRVTDKFYDGVHSLSSIQATTNLGPGAYDCSASGFFEGNARHGSLTPFHKSLPYPSYRNKDKALHDLFTTPKERVTPGPAYYNPKIPHYKIESRNKSKRWSV